MTLMRKNDTEDWCEHLKAVAQAMMDNEITMSHDFEGTFLNCNRCDKSVSLEAYDEKFVEGDLGT